MTRLLLRMTNSPMIARFPGAEDVLSVRTCKRPVGSSASPSTACRRSSRSRTLLIGRAGRWTRGIVAGSRSCSRHWRPRRCRSRPTRSPERAQRPMLSHRLVLRTIEVINNIHFFFLHCSRTLRSEQGPPLTIDADFGEEVDLALGGHQVLADVGVRVGDDAEALTGLVVDQEALAVRRFSTPAS